MRRETTIQCQAAGGFLALLALLVALPAAGQQPAAAHADASGAYSALAPHPVATADHQPQAVDVEVGQPAPLIDGIGWAFGIPRKILLWDRRADNHNVSDTTVGQVAQYIDDRNLHDVKVRVNQYDPGGEWKRLASNKRVGAGWRYTVGAITTLGYTILPGRVFGGDKYNPYTNTLSVYSDAPTLALAEAAYAKDVHQRTLPGTYATAQGLPLVAMWHESLATGEVMHYVSIRGSSEEQEDIRRQLYARYGMELGGVLSGVLTDGSAVFPVVGAASGHAVASIEQAVRGPTESQK